MDAFALVCLSLLATPALIRSFGVDGYGVFVFLSIFSVYGLLSFLDLGMEGSLMNYVARYQAADDRDKLRSCLSISIGFYGTIGAVLATALYLLAGYIGSRFIDSTGVLDRQMITAAVRIVAANVFLQFLALPLNAILQGMRRFVITKSVSTLIMIVQYALLILTAVYFRRIDYGFMAILVASALRLGALSYIALIRLPHFRPLRLSIDREVVRSLTSYSGILFVSRIVGLIFNQMDKFLIWLFLAVARLAVYDVVVRPANLVRMLISIINSAVVPEAARLHQRHDIAGIKVLYIDLVRYAYLIVLPVVVVAWVHIDVLLTLWVGADFAEYGNLVRIMLAVYLIAPLPSMASTIVVGMELVRKTIWISVVASVINVALSLALLKSMGLAGLLTATLVAEVFMLFPYLSMMKHILGLGAAELIQPMTRIMALSAPFVASQLVLGVLPIRSPWLLLSCVAGLASLHAAVHVRYLLTDRERRYLLEKCGMRKRSFVWGNLSR